MLPRLTPDTVKLLPPVVCWESFLRLETVFSLYEIADDKDPVCTPVVTANSKLPCIPVATLASTEVSDTQTVAWVPDCPARPVMLYALTPRSRPLTVMLLPPRVGELTGTAAETVATSYDDDCVRDPTCNPTVTARCREEPNAPGDIAAIEVSDTHTV